MFVQAVCVVKNLARPGSGVHLPCQLLMVVARFLPRALNEPCSHVNRSDFRKGGSRGGRSKSLDRANPTVQTQSSGFRENLVDEVPAGFPADLLYEFRLQSALTAAVMWMVLGTAFAAATTAVSARTPMTVKEVVHAGR